MAIYMWRDDEAAPTIVNYVLIWGWGGWNGWVNGNFWGWGWGAWGTIICCNTQLLDGTYCVTIWLWWNAYQWWDRASAYNWWNSTFGSITAYWWWAWWNVGWWWCPWGSWWGAWPAGTSTTQIGGAGCSWQWNKGWNWIYYSWSWWAWWGWWWAWWCGCDNTGCFDAWNGWAWVCISMFWMNCCFSWWWGWWWFSNWGNATHWWWRWWNANSGCNGADGTTCGSGWWGWINGWWKWADGVMILWYKNTCNYCISWGNKETINWYCVHCFTTNGTLTVW